MEHRIEKTGGGAYRLKSADGGVDRKVAKREVEELNQHYNIQADNPCSLLTQEAAKKFLHNGNESDRYRFFLMAANLGTQKEDLMHVQARAPLPAARLAIRVSPRSASGAAPRPAPPRPTGPAHRACRPTSRSRRKRRRRPRSRSRGSRRWRGWRRRSTTARST